LIKRSPLKSIGAIIIIMLTEMMNAETDAILRIF